MKVICQFRAFRNSGAMTAVSAGLRRLYDKYYCTAYIDLPKNGKHGQLISLKSIKGILSVKLHLFIKFKSDK